ncbi:hypothetical protein EIP91_009113 [Steccherinum ochraceum]|uniref:Uncharacterized protein n=1 Tax=Steccherinum ochraceum TaxID=92696 RepID=A0A4R0R4D4_9APHY|nr:hypothetical protein EIP91_009113 [Steccherinum ochraceum]
MAANTRWSPTHALGWRPPYPPATPKPFLLLIGSSILPVAKESSHSNQSTDGLLLEVASLVTLSLFTTTLKRPSVVVE